MYDPIFGIRRIIEYYNLITKAFGISELKKCICYENLKKDTEKEFYEIMNFISEQKPCMKSISYAVEENEFYKLKRKAELTDNLLLSKKNRSDPDSAKIREGKIGGYRDKLKQSTIDYIDNNIKDNLNKDLDASRMYSQ